MLIRKGTKREKQDEGRKEGCRKSNRKNKKGR